jgi:hypothetical protein
MSCISQLLYNAKMARRAEIARPAFCKMVVAALVFTSGGAEPEGLLEPEGELEEEPAEEVPVAEEEPDVPLALDDEGVYMSVSTMYDVCGIGSTFEGEDVEVELELTDTESTLAPTRSAESPNLRYQLS